jgi:hypothetical protein
MRKPPKLLTLIGLLLLASCVGNSAYFTDDFSDPASGWGAASTETYVRGYDSGKYLIRIDVPQWFVWTTGGYRFDDVALEAVIRSEGMVDNHYGLLCRYEGSDFYYFAVSADGYYAIFHHTEEGMEPLTGPAMLRSPLIHREGAQNRLLAVCQGENLSLYVNGELVDQVEDAALPRGDVGLAAGTLEQGEATLVWFDDLEVRAP